MTAFKRMVFALSLLSPLMLAGCGEGWEMKPYQDREPYTMERTAGNGIEYVRASMAQENGAVLKPEAEENVSVMKTDAIEKDTPPPAAQPESNDAAVQEADHIFSKKQKK